MSESVKIKVITEPIWFTRIHCNISTINTFADQDTINVIDTVVLLVVDKLTAGTKDLHVLHRLINTVSFEQI